MNKLFVFLGFLLLMACTPDPVVKPATPQAADTDNDQWQLNRPNPLAEPDVAKPYNSRESDKLDECAKKYARLLDDDKSAATVIAKKVAAKCSYEISAYIKTIRNALKAKGASTNNRDDTEKDMLKHFKEGSPLVKIVIEEIRAKACAGKPASECQLD